MSDLPVVQLTSKGVVGPTSLMPSSSKSESNRSLIINALSGNLAQLRNLSDARDTQTMKRLLASEEEVLDVLDAGTTMRFLTAYLGITAKGRKVLTGSSRMQERPIGILVEALNKLGGNIKYVKQEGYPPLEIGALGEQLTDHLQIPSNISSQYISALLMIAPSLSKGLTIELVGEIFSEPYIKMTLALMKNFGVEHSWEGQKITVKPQSYRAAEYTIESDWSGASYWYGFMALADSGSLKIEGLRDHSFQGDRITAEVMDSLGVSSKFDSSGVEIGKKGSQKEVSLDFRHCPDLSLTVIVAAAAKKIPLKMTGLESLKIKETDRVTALQNELKKVNVDLIEHSEHHWELIPQGFELRPGTRFRTYDDHRMAMAFAPLSMVAPIAIDDPEVVNKSYPGFWDDVQKIGVEIQ